MQFGFMRHASLTTSLPVNEDFLNGVTTDIRNDYDMKYTCTATQKGFSLRPKFGFTFHSNSFWPEVGVEYSKQDSQTALHISCRPTKVVRHFITCYIVFAALMEFVCVVAAFTNGTSDSFLPLLTPLFLIIFACLLTSIGSDICFKKIMRVFQKHCG